MGSAPDADRRNALLKIGAVCAIVGTLGYLGLFLVHGDLPDQTAESALSWVAQRPFSLLHLGIILCSLLWVAAFLGLAASLADAVPWALGQLGSAAAIVGATLLAVHYRIDGPALEEVADAWVVATGPEKARLLEHGELVLLMTGGGFPLYVALLLGLPFALFGIAVAVSSEYPSILGWLGAVVGVVGFSTGAANFALLALIPIQLFVPVVFLLDLWMLTMGVLMWKRSQRTSSPRQEISR